MEPVLKWPGGKRFLTPILRRYYSAAQADRYIEPFAGGAALFFSVSPSNALLADVNSELINLYIVMRDFPDRLLDELLTLTNSKRTYYELRESSPRSSVKRAVRTYYLQRLSFNGIYRENRIGSFNVPYGYKTRLECADPVAILRASEALQGTELRCQDFRESLRSVGTGDFVYLDPPYTVTHNRNGFIKYNSTLFSWKDQEDLSKLAIESIRRGATVLVSNADHKSVRLLYRSFRTRTIKRLSRIAADPTHRREISEALFIPRGLRLPR